MAITASSAARIVSATASPAQRELLLGVLDEGGRCLRIELLRSVLGDLARRALEREREAGRCRSARARRRGGDRCAGAAGRRRGRSRPLLATDPELDVGVGRLFRAGDDHVDGWHRVRPPRAGARASPGSGPRRAARRRRGRACCRRPRSRRSTRASGSVTTVRGSLRARSAWRTSSSMRNFSGPPTSTIPFTGAPTAVRPTALATSSEAIGWNSTGGSRTVSPSVASAAMLLMNSKNCVACTIEYGMPGVGDQLLLDGLGLEVALVGHALGADHRERHVVLDARRLLGREQVAGRGLEELEHRRVLERGRVGDVDDDVGALEHLGQAFAGERVDAGVGRRRDRLVPVLGELGHDLRADRARCRR